MPLQLKFYQREDLRRILQDFLPHRIEVDAVVTDGEEEEDPDSGSIFVIASSIRLTASDLEIETLVEELVRASGLLDIEKKRLLEDTKALLGQAERLRKEGEETGLPGPECR